MRWSFILTAGGDFRLTGITRDEDLAYDATTNVETSVSRDDGSAFAGRRTGLAPGWPDPSPSVWVLPLQLGAVVRALQAADDPRVQEGSVAGHDVWILDVAVRVNQIAPGSDHMTIAVDQETGLPLSILESYQGAFVRETRIEDPVPNAPLPPDAFTVEIPPDVDVTPIDHGFQAVGLDEVRETVGYAPLIPGEVPDGFQLHEVAVAPTSGPTGVEGANPSSEMVVSLSYRRGLQQFLVTTRLVGPDPALWGDPLATGEGFVDQPEPATFSAGALAGVTGELMLDPRVVPHVWALTDELVVTVSGDLSRAELLSVAGSLSPA